MNGKDLLNARKSRGWVQTKAAARLGVSQAYVALLEGGRRSLPAVLARKAVSVFNLSAELVPLPARLPQVTEDQLARELGRLGYPGFAYLRHGKLKNPAEVLLAALARPNLDSRLAESLPWLLLQYPAVDRNWLVNQARLLNVTNRVGFVVDLARKVAQENGEEHTPGYAALTRLSEALCLGRLEAEDTLAQEALSEAERNWLRQNRPAEATAWHLLTDWRPELLQYRQ